MVKREAPPNTPKSIDLGPLPPDIAAWDRVLGKELRAYRSAAPRFRAMDKDLVLKLGITFRVGDSGPCHSAPRLRRDASAHLAALQARYNLHVAPHAEAIGALLRAPLGRPLWERGHAILRLVKSEVHIAAGVAGLPGLVDSNRDEGQMMFPIDGPAGARRKLLTLLRVCAALPVPADDAPLFNVTIGGCVRCPAADGSIASGEGFLREFVTYGISAADEVTALRIALALTHLYDVLHDEPQAIPFVKMLRHRGQDFDLDAAFEAARNVEDALTPLVRALLDHPQRPAGARTFDQALAKRHRAPSTTLPRPRPTARRIVA